LNLIANRATYHAFVKASGWVVTVTPSHADDATHLVEVWYAALSSQAAALAAVTSVAKHAGAALEISREMSEALTICLGLKAGEVRCFG
jgi:hypothetical protein